MTELIFEDVKSNLVDLVYDIAIENGGIVEKTQWVSKFKRATVYDYKPPCCDNFEVDIFTEFHDKNKAKFTEYLYNKYNNVFNVEE